MQAGSTAGCRLDGGDLVPGGGALGKPLLPGARRTGYERRRAVPTDIFTRLEQDHEEMRVMLNSISESFDEKTFKKLSHELVSHERAEEGVLYEAVVKQQPTHELVLEGLEEHHVADLIMRELKNNEQGTDRWMAKFKVLQENVEHHLEEEENELFPAAKQVVDGGRAQEMTSQFETAKKKVKA